MTPADRRNCGLGETLTNFLRIGCFTLIMAIIVMLCITIAYAKPQQKENRVAQCSVHLPLIFNQEPKLKDLFANHGIRFGFAVGENTFVDAPWNETRRRLVIWHADVVSTGSELNMAFTQPVEGTFDWSKVDKIVSGANEFGISVHGIPASWGLDALNPTWLVDGTWTDEQLSSILKEHVNELAAHYDGKFVSLDVANEAWITGFDPVYGGVWEPLGDDYVYISFESAKGHKYPVLYNSYFPEPSDIERNKALKLVEDGVADGIGIQLHLWTGDWEATLDKTEDFLKQIRAVGGWCRFSEIGILAVDDDEWAQAIVYAAVTRLAIEYSDIVRDFVVWGVKDPAWRGNTTLFDEQGQPKPAYYAIINELRK